MSDCKLEDPKVREDLEGFLGDDFNGVIFLLREPNTDGDEADSFWFKNCLKDTIPKGKDKKTYRGNYQKYEDKFNMMLQCIEPDKELGQAAYFNLRPGSGGPERTHEYRCHLRDPKYVADRFGEILKYCKPKATDNYLYIFTCSDILDAFLRKRSKQQQILRTDPYTIIEEDKQGVQFSYGSKKRRILCKTKDGFQITIFEIHHPSAESEVLPPKDDHV